MSWRDEIRAYGWRPLLVAAVLLASGTGFLWWVHRFYPIQHWLFWSFALYWLGALIWGLACLSLGHVIVIRVLGEPLRTLEQIPVALAVGMFGFEVITFIAGLLQLYSWPLFFILPAAAMAAGGWPLWRYSRRAWRHLGALHRRSPKLPLWVLPAVGFGLLALLMLYVNILTPENTQFDARWKHLGIAEEFVARGGVARFAEGRTMGTRPHFTSFLFAWAFMAPGASLADKVEICAHLEFLVFLMTTLFGIPALVRRLVPRASPALVWVARFLFPGVFLYDSSLAVGIDHFGAFFCIPVFLLALRAYRDLSRRNCAALGAVLAACVLVKYTIAIMLVPGALVMIAVAMLREGRATWRQQGPTRPPREWLLAPLFLAGAALLCSAPLWLTNLIWHSNPVYPLLGDLFPSRPWTTDATYWMQYGFAEHQLWRPERSLRGILESLGATFSFSFAPHNWGALHRDVPVIGSLFTLLVLCLPFLPRTRRVWLLVGWSHLALFAWYWVHHQDRYLQGIMPWLAASVAAIFLLLWRSERWPVRTALLALVAIQLIWGGDVWLIPTHRHIHDAPVRKVASMIAKGFNRKYGERLVIEPDHAALAAKLPDEAVVLVHEEHNTFGLDAAKVSDFRTSQYGISYGELGSMREMYDELRGLGVTHLYWKDRRSRSYDTLAGDIMFFYFALELAGRQQRRSSVRLAPMPVAPPPAQPIGAAVVLGCGKALASGLYEVSDLRIPPFGPRREDLPAPRRSAADGTEAEALVGQATIVIFDPGCKRDYGQGWNKDFDHAFSRAPSPGFGRKYDVYFRKGDPRPL